MQQLVMAELKYTQ